MENVYEQNGYKNRFDYLKSLSEEYGIEVSTVFAIASVLGENEDFDGLVSSLESAY